MNANTNRYFPTFNHTPGYSPFDHYANDVAHLADSFIPAKGYTTAASAKRAGEKAVFRAWKQVRPCVAAVGPAFCVSAMMA